MVPNAKCSRRWGVSGQCAGACVARRQDFACIQKTEHGFDLLDSRAKRALRGMSIKPDMWILPEGLKIYLTNVRRENFDYLIAGPQGAVTFQSRGAAVDKANDCMIFEAKQFELPNEPGPVDVLQRRAVIGEYYVMQNHLRGGIDPAKYRSNMRDIFLYNEARRTPPPRALRTRATRTRAAHARCVHRRTHAPRARIVGRRTRMRSAA